MSFDTAHARGPTSLAHDFYEVMFQGVDIASSCWQPMLKAAGRWQLEVAHLAARQVRATMMLTSGVVHAGSSSSALKQVYRDYWDEMSKAYSEANHNIASAFAYTAIGSAAPAMPLRSRDTLHLIDGAEMVVPDNDPDDDADYRRRKAA